MAGSNPAPGRPGAMPGGRQEAAKAKSGEQKGQGAQVPEIGGPSTAPNDWARASVAVRGGHNPKAKATETARAFRAHMHKSQPESKEQGTFCGCQCFVRSHGGMLVPGLEMDVVKEYAYVVSRSRQLRETCATCAETGKWSSSKGLRGFPICRWRPPLNYGTSLTGQGRAWTRSVICHTNIRAHQPRMGVSRSCRCPRV